MQAAATTPAGGPSSGGSGSGGGGIVCELPLEPSGNACICPETYHVETPDGRCVWSCGEGTQPDNISNECVCIDGLSETGQDELGRRVCG